MTKKSRPSAEVVDAWVDMCEGVFVTLMQGILKATTVEAEYAGLASEVRQLTQQEIHRIARSAAERYVQLANPDLGAGSKDKINSWKREAIEYALRKRK